MQLCPSYNKPCPFKRTGRLCAITGACADCAGKITFPEFSVENSAVRPLNTVEPAPPEDGMLGKLCALMEVLPGLVIEPGPVPVDDDVPLVVGWD